MQYAETRDRTGDLQIFNLTLSQLRYRRSDPEGVALPKWVLGPLGFLSMGRLPEAVAGT